MSFPDVTREDWLARAARAAKGVAFDTDVALQGRIEGPRALRGVHGPWKIFQRIDQANDLSKAQSQIEDDLNNGVDGLVLTSIDVAGVLPSLPLHKIALRNEGGDEGAEAIRFAVKDMPVDPSRLAIDFGIQDASLARIVNGDGFASPLMKADGTMFHTQGADHATELGAILAEMLGRWRMLDFLDDTSLAQAVSMKLIATQDMFGTLAKFRAARIVFADLLRAVGLPATPLLLHGESSRLMLADVDAHTNILRNVCAASAAGIGGADSFCALPFSFNQGVPNGFARRVARNTQHVLLNESQLWRVEDAARGAGAIEKRTEQICEDAWLVMQACERSQWPKAQASKNKATPVIGVSKYRPEQEPMREVEKRS
jgi:methylmalonyl-CoA mutase